MERNAYRTSKRVHRRPFGNFVVRDQQSSQVVGVIVNDSGDGQTKFVDAATLKAAWQSLSARRGLLYCVLANADVEDRAATEEILSALRSPTPSASSPDSGADTAMTG